MIFAYLVKRQRETRMPRRCELGIRYEGPVLSGRMSLEGAFEMERRAQAARAGERYRRVEEYDGVLRGTFSAVRE
jgi:hypothetical protein